MNIAIATDFNGSGGQPFDSLRAIADAGFTHLHWCHQWNTDFFYGKYEIAEIKAFLKQYDLKLLDVHGSAGQLKCWYAEEEFRRKSGVELAVNRMQMMHELEASGALMMHALAFCTNDAPEAREVKTRQLKQQMRTLEELMPYAEKYGIPIALENWCHDTYETLPEYLKAFPAKYLGITYDSGHGNIDTHKGLEFLEAHKDRLQALHLHDNDGVTDQHKPPYCGNIDWNRLTTVIADSSYDRVVSFELSMRNTPFFDQSVTGPQGPEMVEDFLIDAYERCAKVTKFVEVKRQMLRSGAK